MSLWPMLMQLLPLCFFLSLFSTEGICKIIIKDWTFYVWRILSVTMFCFYVSLQIKSASSTQFLHCIQNSSSGGDRVKELTLLEFQRHTFQGVLIWLLSLLLLVCCGQGLSSNHILILLFLFYNWMTMFCRSSSQMLGYAGISYSSPALASSIGNLVPAFTFILAVMCRFTLLIFVFGIFFIETVF